MWLSRMFSFTGFTKKNTELRSLWQNPRTRLDPPTFQPNKLHQLNICQSCPVIWIQKNSLTRLTPCKVTRLRQIEVSRRRLASRCKMHTDFRGPKVLIGLPDLLLALSFTGLNTIELNSFSYVFWSLAVAQHLGGEFLQPSPDGLQLVAVALQGGALLAADVEQLERLAHRVFGTVTLKDSSALLSSSQKRFCRARKVASAQW